MCFVLFTYDSAVVAIDGHGGGAHFGQTACISITPAPLLHQLTKAVRALQKDVASNATLNEEVEKLRSWKESKAVEIEELMEKVCRDPLVVDCCNSTTQPDRFSDSTWWMVS